MHRKKRGKRDAEQTVKEFNVILADPSPENLSVYATKRVSPMATTAMDLPAEHVKALQEIVFMLSDLISQTPAWKAQIFEDLVVSLTLHPETFEAQRNALWIVSRRDKLSQAQMTGFPASIPVGLLVDQRDTEKRSPSNQSQGFR